MPKTVPIDLEKVVDNGELIHNWIGNLWNQIFKDRELVRANNAANGLLSTQLYLNFIETLKLLDRKAAPVFHRERWRSIVLKKSEQNKAKANAFQVGDSIVPRVGPNNHNILGGTPKAKLGGFSDIPGVTAYPIPEDIVDVIVSVTDSINTPSKIFIRGIDFEVSESSILFFNNNDPFLKGFPVLNTPDGLEVQIWATDVLFDKDFVYDFSGHVLGIREPSSEFYANYLNALWDIFNQGASIALFRSGIAAVLGEPYIQEEKETIEYIIDTANGGRQVITDAHVYNITPNAVLRSKIVIGAELGFGELLTENIRIYDNLDPTRLSANSEYFSRLRSDVPSISLDPAFFRARIEQGLSVTWDKVPLEFTGRDANGNPKLRFKIYGNSEDVETFWQDFWDYSEATGISGTACFPNELNATLLETVGATWGTVSPAEYFLYNFLKANFLVVVVDSSNLTAQGKRNMYRLGALHDAIPAHVTMLIVDRVDIPTDEYDMDIAEDSVFPIFSKKLSERAGPDEFIRSRLTYGDAKPIVHLIPKC